MSNLERTLSIIKPDAVERNLENEIKEMFKNNGFLILKPFLIKFDFICCSRFLSTASGLIIDKVCSASLIRVFN